MLYVQLSVLIFSVITALLGAFNAYRNSQLKLMVSELRFNVMRDMNGRYVRLDSFQDLKDRVVRIEQHELE